MENKRLEIAKSSWSKAPDHHIQEAMEKLNGYDVAIREIIIEEAKRRKISNENEIEINYSTFTVDNKKELTSKKSEKEHDKGYVNSLILHNATVNDIDKAVWSWAKRVYLSALLIVGIPTIIIFLTIGFFSGFIQEEITKYDKTKNTKEFCYKCERPATGYWYPTLRPNYRVYVCAEHFDSYEARNEAIGGVQTPYMIFIITCSIVIGPFMLYKYRPKFPQVVSLSNSNIKLSPPSWFWVGIISTIIFMLSAPINLYIACRVRRAYIGLQDRIQLCGIAFTISLLFSILVFLQIIMVLLAFYVL